MSETRETRVDWPVVEGLRLRCITWRGDGPRTGTVVICMGRTEFIEKYGEVVQHLLDRRLDVVAFEWRGQGLSDRLLDDRTKGHVGSYEDYLADLRAVTELVDARSFPSPRIMLAHSMGGQIGLRFIHDLGGWFAGAAMTSPMFRIRFGNLPDLIVRAAAEAMCLIGRSDSYAFGQGSGSYAYQPFAENVLTSSEERFLGLRAFLDADPDLRIGGPTFGWLLASLRSMSITTTSSFARSIECPILIAVAQNERIVDNEAIVRMAGWLPQATLFHVPGARHEILIEQPQIQALFWKAFDDWFSRLGEATPPSR